MTKDEARLEFFEAVAKVALKIRVRERNLIEATGDAYAHAAAEDALDVERRTQIVMEANHDEGQYEEDADTLGMLEALAKSTRKSISVGGILIVSWATTLEGGVFDYRKWTGKAPDDYEFISRAEAEALLAGNT